jgi:hypothetical protein
MIRQLIQFGKHASNKSGPLFWTTVGREWAAIHTWLLSAQGFTPGGGVAAGVALVAPGV